MTTTTTAGKTTNKVAAVIYVKGMKARIDISEKGRSVSFLQDVASKQQLVVNHYRKLVQIIGPRAHVTGPSDTMSEPVVSVTPSGRTRMILGRECNGYSINYKRLIAVGDGASAGLSTGSGQIWVAETGRDVEEYLALKAAATAIGITTSPLLMGPLPTGAAEIEGTFSDRGMLLLEEMKYNFEMRDPGPPERIHETSWSRKVKVSGITTEPIPDAIFIVPAGYATK